MTTTSRPSTELITEPSTEAERSMTIALDASAAIAVLSTPEGFGREALERLLTSSVERCVLVTADARQRRAAERFVEVHGLDELLT